ncbi:MAG: PEP-CTERM sorting domain-containing protein [Terrimicrobiaceae bacterium]|nr:PEP-CTERM sorting domain-containing protein [Terrimicrobiaceae bacterium]
MSKRVPMVSAAFKSGGFLLLILLGFPGTQSAQITDDTTMHQNNFHFWGMESSVNVGTPDDPRYVNVPAPTNVRFVWGVDPAYTSNSTAFSITEGQPWDGTVTAVTNSTNSSLCTLTINAGRKNSTEPADFFKNATSGGAMGGWDVISNAPDKLNFAFVGTLSFDLEGTTYSYYIALGQGNQGAINNWWLGGPEMLGGQEPFPENVIAPSANGSFNIIASRSDTWDIYPLFVPVPVPEPSVGGLLILGLAGATVLSSRIRKKAA